MKTKLTLIASAVLLTITPLLHAQSLLTTSPETDAQIRAREVLVAPAQTRDVLLNQLNDATSRLWDAPDPQAVLDVIGPKAAELFTLNQAFAGIIAQLLTVNGDTAGLARLQGIAAKIKPHVVNQDGTVTILPTPTPEPTP
jgi:hypothetical protein